VTFYFIGLCNNSLAGDKDSRGRELISLAASEKLHRAGAKWRKQHENSSLRDIRCGDSLAVAASSAQAQGPGPARQGGVLFPFVVDHEILPAGTYEFQLGTSGAFSVSSADGQQGAHGRAMWGYNVRPGGSAKLVFHVLGKASSWPKCITRRRARRSLTSPPESVSKRKNNRLPARSRGGLDLRPRSLPNVGKLPEHTTKVSA
jgi:hypothetical protein